MNYYPFHIGDYRSSTAHLTNEEDLCYRRLLDFYYDTEAPIPTETQWVARRIRVDTEVVARVLQDMFKQTENGWIHARCDQEIAHYNMIAERNRSNGKHGGRPRKNPVGTQSKPTGKPTKNQEPRTKNQEPNIKQSAGAPPDGVCDSVWQDFTQLRKAKKAPITPSAIAGIEREAKKAGVTLESALEECCSRGWVGFKASWMVERTPPANVAQLTVPSKQGIDPALARIIHEQLSGAVKPPSADMRAKLDALRRSH